LSNVSEKHVVTIRLKVALGEEIYEFVVKDGTNLRRLLLQENLSPYTILTRNANCGGRGICATCGVWVNRGIPKPRHWHDKLATSFGYPRLSCQIHVEQDMEIELIPEKWIWGKRDPERKLDMSDV
jgi:ferredoxin